MSTSTMSRAMRATIALDLDIHGPLTAEADALSQTVQLDAHQRQSVTIPIAAAGVGTADARPQDYRARRLDRRSISRSASSRARPTSIAAPCVCCTAGATRDDLRRSARRLHSRHRVDLGRRLAVRRARRAGAVAGARALPLRLLGADGQPRDAAALRQPARFDRSIWRSIPISTGASRRRSSGR